MADPSLGVLTSLLGDDMAPPVSIEGATVTQTSDGTEVAFDDGEAAAGAIPLELLPFNANLAVALGEQTLTRLSQRVIDCVEADTKARASWRGPLSAALETLGVIGSAENADKFVIRRASQVRHPLVLEAIVRFQAMAKAELFPAGGPAKPRVLGAENEELTAQGDRVVGWLNYCLTERDPGYVEDSDQLLFYVGMIGSHFRKVWRDTYRQRTMARGVDAEHLLVPFTAKTLEESPRITHLIPISRLELKRQMKTGKYIEVDLGSAGWTHDDTDSASAREQADDRSASYAEEDDDRLLYECHLTIDDLEPDASGMPMEYMVTVEKETQKVIGIYRNWEEADQLRLRRVHFTHYKLFPGAGFYGMGFLHLIGQLGEAATGLLRGIIDGAARANFSGGFRSKQGRKAGSVTPGLGEWVDVDLDAEELKNAFFPLPYTQPGAQGFQALDAVEKNAQRLGMTTDTLVGASGNSGPVGTTMALIEQGTKPQAGTHSRLHAALSIELKLYAAVERDNVPPEGYPYQVEGADKLAMATDFDDRVDVTPVSDPNVVSSSQRILRDQGALQLSQQAPGLYPEQGVRMLHRRLLKSMGVPDVDAILPLQPPPPPIPPQLDPVTENLLLMKGKPIAAYPDQDHDAHLIVHGYLRLYIQRLPPEAAKPLDAALAAHEAEHLGYSLAASLEDTLGHPLPTVGPDGQPMTLPPPLEAKVSALAANAAAKAKGPKKLPALIASATAEDAGAREGAGGGAA